MTLISNINQRAPFFFDLFLRPLLLFARLDEGGSFLQRDVQLAAAGRRPQGPCRRPRAGGSPRSRRRSAGDAGPLTLRTPEAAARGGAVFSGGRGPLHQGSRALFTRAPFPFPPLLSASAIASWVQTQKNSSTKIFSKRKPRFCVGKIFGLGLFLVKKILPPQGSSHITTQRPSPLLAQVVLSLFV